jgi:hypothetical protein
MLGEVVAAGPFDQRQDAKGAKVRQEDFSIHFSLAFLGALGVLAVNLPSEFPR